MHLAKQKAVDVFKRHTDDIVIGADTIVLLNNEILGKPKDKEDVKRMITMLNDNTHEVITGVCIKTQESCKTFKVVTKVTFKKMSEEEIESYCNLETVYDKAGAYAIQEDAGQYITSIEGDYNNVVGLPVDELRKLKSLPSTIIADNCLFYGEYEIIGNIPLTENEDYPIMYGRSIDIRKKSICFQYGKTFKEIENGVLLYGGFTNNGVSFTLNIQKNVLLECIQANSNIPYWENYFEYAVNRDLRNPKYHKERIDIGNQMGAILE